MHGILATTAILGLTLTGATVANEPDASDAFLTIGEKAPKLDIAHWVEREKIDRFEDGKVYVIEFWATWCRPCIAAMPHLASLQRKYRDDGVTFLGVSDESLPAVVRFLWRDETKADSDDTVGYTLACDPDRSTHRDYLVAAGQGAIPCTFIIGKDGRVEWIGRPMKMEGPLAQVVRDEWDRASFRAAWETKMAPLRASARTQKRLSEARQSADWEEVLAIFEELSQESPQQAERYRQKIFTTLLYVRPDDGYARGRELMEASWGDAFTLKWIARTVVDDPYVKRRDLDFALKATRRANELRGGTDAAVLLTLARIHYLQDDLMAAVEWQRMAVDHAIDERSAQDARKTLVQYEAELAGN
jgi:thiol-disulfide isomerase/thioredoxin